MDTPVILGVISALGGIAVAAVGARNSSKANSQSAANSREVNRLAEDAGHLEWVKQARSEAKEAYEELASVRLEMRELRTEATSARQEVDGAMRDLADARRQARAMTGHLESVMSWVDRVVRYAADMRTEQVHDPKAIRLLAIINGGPPDISGSQIQRPARDN